MNKFAISMLKQIVLNGLDKLGHYHTYKGLKQWIDGLKINELVNQ